MTHVKFTAPARTEFLKEIAYYNEKEPGLGVRFASAVEEATARALAFPLAGSIASTNTRRVFVRDFPFSVVYRYNQNGIVIFAIAHHSRYPGYWQSRVQDR